MEDWGYLLITSGIIWVFAKLLIDSFRPPKQPAPGARELAGGGSNVVLNLEGFAKLAATTYGPGLILSILGVVLLLGANGFSVNVGTGTVATPAPAASEPFPFPLPTLPTLPTPSP
jgi:hypothetical protein